MSSSLQKRKQSESSRSRSNSTEVGEDINITIGKKQKTNVRNNSNVRRLIADELNNIYQPNGRGYHAYAYMGNDNDKKDFTLLSNRIDHIKRCAFNKKRIVVFSGGNSKNTDDLLDEIRQINLGGGNGSIIGRNTFQRPKDEAISLLKKIIAIYKNE